MTKAEFALSHQFSKNLDRNPEREQASPDADMLLWHRFQSGEMVAFETIYSIYQPSLYHYGLSIVRHSDLVKDTLQDLFVELWNRRERFSRVKNIRAFLFAIMRRQLIRAAQREGKLLSLSDDQHRMLSVSSRETSLLREESDKLISEKLEKALLNLSKRQQELIHLRYRSDFSNVEIAKITEIPYRKVGYLLRTALKSLNKALVE